ncbi:MAG: TPM domain-containing protein [Desulfobacterales bacterium]|jgi:uncharacterized protein
MSYQRENNKISCVWTVAAVLVLFPAAVLLALEVPQLKGRVNDYAGMLSAHTERRLDETLRRLEQTDSTQIVVFTIPSLQGENLEAFSIRVAEQWEIGQKGLDNGAILLIAKKERKIRIEVGYGLEGRLTDLVSGQVIRNVIVPQFRAGNIDQGVMDGVQAMIAVVHGEFTAATKTKTREGRKTGSHPGIFSLVFFVALINMLGRLRRPLGAATGGLLFPIIGAMFFNLGLIWILALIPLGVFGGTLLSFLGSPLSFGHMASARRHGGAGWFGGSGSGGFSSGGFGGFSGGGGGFGGGGASGGW